jgi:hypothetical protein
VIVVLIAVVVGAAFGGIDQYLGSIASWPWAVAFSLMSAPWLLLPFGFGCTQTEARRAALVGLIATMAALVAYGAMTLSPFEFDGGHSSYTWAAVAGLSHSMARYAVGGLVTAPLYGLLGRSWRTSKSLSSVLFTAGALILEPATRVFQLESGPALPYVIELSVGVVLSAYFVAATVSSRRHVGGLLSSALGSAPGTYGPI